jgi:tyrosyl-tRNA synthetase
MDLFDELKWRGLLDSVSDEKKINNFVLKKLPAYIGFDPTFKSLHLGNYIMICVIKLLIKYKHNVYAIIGGITGLIGDPKDPKLTTSSICERILKTKEEINMNIKFLSKEIYQHSHCSEVINNIEFYKNMTV